ncbi:MAG TPA: hypothetical protein VIU86_05995, partial [Gaiellaceae bacterium]
MDDSRPYGRRAFLATTLGGPSALWWAEPLWRSIAGAARPLEAALPSGLVPSGWRIYTVASTMPRFDPAAWRLRIQGRVARPVE